MTDVNDDIPFAIEVGEGAEATDNVDIPEEDVRRELVVQEENLATEDEMPGVDSETPEGTNEQRQNNGPQLSLREFLFGDFIIGTFLLRELPFILFLMLLAILYISNRYAAQQEIIEEEQLRKELVEKKNYALTRYAELTMASRQSGLEERLKAFGDSLLQTATEPPFVIQSSEQ